MYRIKSNDDLLYRNGNGIRPNVKKSFTISFGDSIVYKDFEFKSIVVKYYKTRTRDLLYTETYTESDLIANFCTDDSCVDRVVEIQYTFKRNGYKLFTTNKNLIFNTDIIIKHDVCFDYKDDLNISDIRVYLHSGSFRGFGKIPYYEKDFVNVVVNENNKYVGYYPNAKKVYLVYDLCEYVEEELKKMYYYSEYNFGGYSGFDRYDPVGDGGCPISRLKEVITNDYGLKNIQGNYYVYKTKKIEIKENNNSDIVLNNVNVVFESDKLIEIVNECSEDLW